MGSSSSELSVSSIMSMPEIVGRVGEDMARRFWASWAFTRFSTRSAFLMASVVGSKIDDLKTCLSPKSTAFLQVGPESQKASNDVNSVQMTTHRDDIPLLRRPRTLVHVHRRDHCTHVGRKKNKRSCCSQLTVVGDRGPAQL